MAIYQGTATLQLRDGATYTGPREKFLPDEEDLLRPVNTEASFLRKEVEELQAENERLREVLTYARQALETLGIGKRTREEAMRLIDEAMK